MTLFYSLLVQCPVCVMDRIYQNVCVVCLFDQWPSTSATIYIIQSVAQCSLFSAVVRWQEGQAL